jgi:head-tail adaptor
VARYRLTLEDEQRVSDGAGGYTKTWVTVASVWAELRPGGGGEGIEVGRFAGRLSHTVTPR